MVLARTAFDVHAVVAAPRPRYRQAVQREITSLNQHAVQRRVPHGKVRPRESRGAAGDVQTVAAAGERERADLHQVGIVESDERLRSVVRNGRSQLRHLAGIGRPAQQETAIRPEGGAGATGKALPCR